MNISYLQTALELAHHAIGLSSPNPRVGCVLVKDGQVIGQGHTQSVGQAHAEVVALRDAQQREMDTVGATAYVTLEPCSHYGRTPPCAHALILARVAKVVVACLDPNPQVAGQGVEKLRAAGIAVEVLLPEHELARAAYELNIGFMTRMQYHRPFTRLKWAQSADGKTALPTGRSQWITGAAARLDGHRWRARADVLVTGIGTVLHDDPQLNVRGVELANQPIKCVVDAWAHTPVHAKVFDEGQVWLVCAQLDEAHPNAGAQAMRLALLEQTHDHLTVVRLPTVVYEGDAHGGDVQGGDVQHERVDLRALWAYFAEQSFNEIHVEAGATLNAALLEAGLVDELLMYLAPRVVGAGLPAANFAPSVQLDDLQQAGQWRWLDALILDDDVRLRLRKN